MAKKLKQGEIADPWVLVLNLFLAVFVYIFFSSVSGSYLALPKIILFFLLLSVPGYLVFRITSKRFFNLPYEINTLFSSLIGMAIVTIISLFFLYFKLNMLLLGIVLLVLFFSGLYMLVSDMISRRIYFEPRRIMVLRSETSFLLVLVLIAAFLVSDTMITTTKGAYIYDPLHSTYETSIAQSILNDFHDLSYQGKEMKFHYGNPFVILMLNKLLGFDILLVNNFIIQFICLTMFVLLFYTLALILTKKKDVSLISSFFILLGSIYFFPVSIIDLQTMCYPFAGCLNNMPSYGFGIIYSIAFLIVFMLEKNTCRNLFLSSLMLSSIVIFKATIALPMILAFVLFISSLFVFKKAKRAVMLYLLVIIFPLFLLFLFVLGGHSHVIWIILPGGGIHTYIPFMQKMSLLPVILLTPFVALFSFTGVMIYYALKYLLKECSRFLKEKKKAIDASKSFGHYRDYIILFVIFSSISMSFFLTDIVEQNNTQFMIPAQLVLAVLFINRLFELSKKRKALRFLVVLLVVLSILMTTSFSLFEKNYLNTPLDNKYEVNPLSRAKLGFSAYNTGAFLWMVKKADSCLGSSFLKGFGAYEEPERGLNRLYFYSDGLLASLNYLSKNMENEQIFVFGRHYEEDVTRKALIDMWFPDSFIRTGVSGKQTLVENIKFKGLVMQPDYFQRSSDVIRFFYYIVNESTRHSKSWETLRKNPSGNRFEGRVLLRKYISFFSDKPNFFDVIENYIISIEGSIDEIYGSDAGYTEKAAFASKFVEQYNVDYILFERNEKPGNDMLEEIGFEKVFEKGDASVYRRKD